MALITIALLNGLLGATCGLWFKVQILIPLIAIAFVEVAIVKQTEMWPSAIWSAIVMICSIEMGYLIGSSVGALWLYSGSGRVLRDITRHGHGGLSPH
jgi:uncharacterized membrane protein